MDSKRCAEILKAARADGRSSLLEAEVYDLLAAAGCRTPRFAFVARGAAITAKQLTALGSKRVAVKVVSAHIAHKTDVGGVCFVSAKATAVTSVMREMEAEVPARMAARLAEQPGHRPETWAGLAPDRLPGAILAEIRGFLVVEMVTYKEVFGHELIVAVRQTPDFGPVVALGAGGVRTEFFAARMARGQALAMTSAESSGDGREDPGGENAALAAMAARTAVHPILTGQARGSERLIAADELTGVLAAFARLGREFSDSSGAELVLAELEVNPFVVAAGALIAIDGLANIRPPRPPLELPRPVAKLQSMLEPESAGLIGVSEKMNVGHIILNNMIKQGMPRDRIVLVKPRSETIEGCRCVDSIAAMPENVDLFVIAVGAAQVPETIENLVTYRKAEAVILIPGGLGEKSGTESLAERVRDTIRASRATDWGGPLVNGGNCLGIYSQPGRYDTLFIPDAKLPRGQGDQGGDLAFVSQSGAFMIARMSKILGFNPRYAISIGNQVDVTVSDYLAYLAGDPGTRTIAIYVEGFRPGDGLAFARGTRAALAAGKQVIVYKAGRTREGAKATSGHTASIAGEYEVCEQLLEEAGALVCASFDEFEDFIRLFATHGGKSVAGNRVSAISNAGFESVGLADSLRIAGLTLQPYSPETRQRLSAILKTGGIDALVDLNNPLGVTPMANDEIFAECARAILEDEAVDCGVIAVIPLTGAMNSLAAGADHREDTQRDGSTARRLIALGRQVAKPFVVSVDSGRLYDPMADMIQAAGIPVFREADRAMQRLGRFMAARLRLAER